MEQLALYLLSKDGDPSTVSAAQKAAGAILMQTPLAAMNCPSRRPAEVFDYPEATGWPQYAPQNADLPSKTARSDYAGNAGSFYWTATDGPMSLDQGTDAWWVANVESQSQFTQVNGIFFNRSQLRIAQITDGTSNTYLAGEKCLDPDHYTDGMTWGDDGSTFIGFDGDTNRWTDQPPVQDGRVREVPTPSAARIRAASIWSSATARSALSVTSSMWSPTVASAIATTAKAIDGSKF